jgi:hypothetical protein
MQATPVLCSNDAAVLLIMPLLLGTETNASWAPDKKVRAHPEVGRGGGWREALNAEASLASKTDCCSAYNRF